MEALPAKPSTFYLLTLDPTDIRVQEAKSRRVLAPVYNEGRIVLILAGIAVLAEAEQ